MWFPMHPSINQQKPLQHNGSTQPHNLEPVKRKRHVPGASAVHYVGSTSVQKQRRMILMVKTKRRVAGRESRCARRGCPHGSEDRCFVGLLRLFHLVGKCCWGKTVGLKLLAVLPIYLLLDFLERVSHRDCCSNMLRGSPELFDISCIALRITYRPPLYWVNYPIHCGLFPKLIPEPHRGLWHG